MNIHVRVCSKPISQVTEMIVYANGHTITEYSIADFVITDNTDLALDALEAYKQVAMFDIYADEAMTELRKYPADRVKIFAPTEQSIEWLDRFATFLVELKA